MKLRTTLTFLLVAASAAAETAPGSLRIESGYPFVEGFVNGAGPFRMLVDSGADSCALTPKAAQAAGLRFNARVVVSTVAGDNTVPVSNENEVRIGERTRAKVEFAVSQLTGIRQVDDRVDGVIGQSFLHQAPWMIDYRTKRLWLDEDAVQHGESLPSSAVSVAHPRETILTVVTGSEKTARRLMVDSGSSDLVLECASNCPRLAQVESFNVRTNQGTGTMRRGVLNELNVGGVAFAGKTAALREPDGADFDGLLPASWFSSIYVDSTRNVVRFAAAK